MTVDYPFTPHTGDNASTITVSTMLAQPTRITRYLSDLSLAGFVAGRIFASPTGVTGGAVVYDQLTYNDLFTDRDVQNVAPGAEFPIVTSPESAPKVAPVEKFGGKFFVTDEARDRNQLSVIQNGARRIMNTILRKNDAKAITALEAALASGDIQRTQHITGTNWSSVTTAGANASTAALWPVADFAKVTMAAERAETGANPTLWIVNPAQRAQFSIIYGPSAAQVLSAYGVTMVSSNHVPDGVAYAVEPGMAGEIRLEKPLSTETWREEATQRTWVQADMRAAYAVTNPLSVFKITGLKG